MKEITFNRVTNALTDRLHADLAETAKIIEATFIDFQIDPYITIIEARTRLEKSFDRYNLIIDQFAESAFEQLIEYLIIEEDDDLADIYAKLVYAYINLTDLKYLTSTPIVTISEAAYDNMCELSDAFEMLCGWVVEGGEDETTEE